MTKLTAWPGDDSMNGQGGDDALYGGDGNDSIGGGVGSDWLDGGLGVISSMAAPTPIDCWVVAATIVLFGGSGNDYLDAGIGGNNVLRLSARRGRRRHPGNRTGPCHVRILARRWQGHYSESCSHGGGVGRDLI